jgi:hypothetical protein
MNLMDSAKLKSMRVKVFGSNRHEPFPSGSRKNLFGAGNISQVPGAVSIPLILSSIDATDSNLSERIGKPKSMNA